MNARANVDVSMVIPMGILVSLFKILIRKGSSKSGRFVGKKTMSPFIVI